MMRVQNHDTAQMADQLQRFAEARQMARKRILDQTPQQKLFELINVKKQETQRTFQPGVPEQAPAAVKTAADNPGIIYSALKKANELLQYNQDSKPVGKSVGPQIRGNYVDLVA